MFYKTRESIARRSVRRKKKQIIRAREVHNFSNSKRVGIYFETTDSEVFRKVREFSRELEKNNVQTSLLVYVEMEEIPAEMSLWDNCHVCLSKDLDWAFRPKTEFVDSFLKEEFDIFFDFSLHESLQGYYIHSLSRSHFKVGRYRELENDIDFMIDTSQDNSIDFLIEQVKTYVPMLNKQEK